MYILQFFSLLKSHLIVQHKIQFIHLKYAKPLFIELQETKMYTDTDYHSHRGLKK